MLCVCVCVCVYVCTNRRLNTLAISLDATFSLSKLISALGLNEGGGMAVCMCVRGCVRVC